MIYASAPGCLLDVGGWSTAACAEHGAVLTGAMEPRCRVALCARGHGVVVRRPADDSLLPAALTAEQYLLIAARHFGVEKVEARLDAAPPGTEAAVQVALTAALARFVGRALPPLFIAALAHTLRGASDGMPAHLAAALGGVIVARVEPYPRVRVAQTVLTERRLLEVERNLLRVQTGFYLISRISECTFTHHRAAACLPRLRALPGAAAHALSTGDADAFTAVLRDHTGIQQQIHPALFTPELCSFIDLAALCNAHLAGIYAGGTVTLYTPPSIHTPLIDILNNAGYSAAPACIARHGVQVWAEGEQTETAVEM